MNTVQSLLRRARRAVITHDAKVIIKRIQAMRLKRFPTIRKYRPTQAVRARRSPASVRRATVDSGGDPDPDPEPPRSNNGGAL